MANSDIKYFFSYANDDAEFALSLAKRLRSHNANIWMDKLDLRAGKPWDDGVEAALEECPGMILVLSPSSVASQNVKDEVAYAFDEGMTIIPLLYKRCKVPFRIRRLQFIDFTEGLEKSTPELLRSLSVRPITQDSPDEKGNGAVTQATFVPEPSLSATPARPLGGRTFANLAVGAAVIAAALWYWAIIGGDSAPQEKTGILPDEVQSQTDEAKRGVGRYNAPVLEGDFAGSDILDTFIEDFSTRHNVEQTYLYGVFSLLKSNKSIHKAWERGVGEVGWPAYRDLFVNTTRISRGETFLDQHMDTMVRAEQVFGVPREYVAAIIGVETNWGEMVGKFQILDALVNSLHSSDPSRVDFFLSAIEEFLLFTQSQQIDPLAPVGSYAGAMGYGQFLPSTFMQYGVDFDGNGKKDPWSVPDTVASIANHLKQNGWQRRKAVISRAVESVLPAQETLQTGLDASHTLGYLEESGIHPSLTNVSTDPADEVFLLRLEGDGESKQIWIGFNNFRVITRFNRSIYYAMVVHLLAEELGSH